MGVLLLLLLLHSRTLGAKPAMAGDAYGWRNERQLRFLDGISGAKLAVATPNRDADRSRGVKPMAIDCRGCSKRPLAITRRDRVTKSRA